MADAARSGGGFAVVNAGAGAGTDTSGSSCTDEDRPGSLHGQVKS